MLVLGLAAYFSQVKRPIVPLFIALLRCRSSHFLLTNKVLVVDSLSSSGAMVLSQWANFLTSGLLLFDRGDWSSSRCMECSSDPPHRRKKNRYETKGRKRVLMSLENEQK